jgi:hypothetical protein
VKYSRDVADVRSRAHRQLKIQRVWAEETQHSHALVHDRCEYRIGGTTVLSNTRGYPGEWGFDPSLIYGLKQLPEMWAKALESGESAKPLIEERSGPSMSITDVAWFLDVSEHAVYELLVQRELIAYPSLHDGRSRFPSWQFSESLREAWPWVPTVICAYGGNGWGLIDFFTVPRLPDGFSYINGLYCGKITVAEIISAAGRVAPS